MNNTNNQPPKQTQDVMILCPVREAKGLVDDVVDMLIQMVEGDKDDVTVLLYGVMQRGQGFIALESAVGVPAAFNEWLKVQKEVIDFVVYDVPTFYEEPGGTQQ